MIDVDGLLKKAKAEKPCPPNMRNGYVLPPYEAIIRTLRTEKKFTYKAISSFLSDNGVQATPSGVYTFCKRRGI